MFIAYIVVAVLLAAVLTMSGRGKLVKDERITGGLIKMGVPPSWFPYLAACLLAGALGLIVGIFIAPIGIAAAIGIILYFLGAIGAHVRAGDIKGLPVPAVLMLFGAAALVLRILSS
jgi:hypothetical protein